MFHFVEELWKGQKYLQSQYDFIIPDSIYFKEKCIEWYFSSKKQRNQILKKREENSTIKHVIQFFQIGDLVKDLEKSKSGYTFRSSSSSQQNNRLVGTVFKMNLQISNIVNVRHLTLKELAIMIQDYQVYPHLYNHPDLELGSHYFRVHLMSKFQTIEIQRSGKPQTFELQEEEFENLPVNDKREERLTLMSRSIVSIINKSQFKLGEVSDITLYYKYYQSSYYLIACKQIEFSGLQGNQKFTIKFQESRDFLYNQTLYNEFQKAMHNQLIQEDKRCKQLKISCACCKLIVLKGETFQILSNKIWQIQVARELHHLSKTPGKFMCEQNYKFVDVCQLCYDEFLNSCKKDYKMPEIPKQLTQTSQKQKSIQNTAKSSNDQKGVGIKSYSIDTKFSEVDIQSDISKTRSNSRQNKQDLLNSEKQTMAYFPIAEIFETLPMKIQSRVFNTQKQNQSYSGKPPLSKINQTLLIPTRVQSSGKSQDISARYKLKDQSCTIQKQVNQKSKSRSSTKNQIRSFSANNTYDFGFSTDASSRQLDHILKQQFQNFIYKQFDEDQIQ